MSKHLDGRDIPSSDITPKAIFEKRRQLITAAGSSLIASSGASLLLSSPVQAAASKQGRGEALKAAPSRYMVTEKQTPYELVTTYNNFYEFGLDKSDPARNAHTLKTRPWTVSVEGACKKPRTFGIEELLTLAPLEERIYRFRCVEAWSMVVPWIGYSLSELLKKVEPTGNAKFVEFVSLADPKQMPGLDNPSLDWPYVEGLRMDEAMNPLTLLTMGLYGEVLPNQNGAPVRINVPWKYGFKSAKSIVKIRLVEKEPLTSWVKSAASEYGFYSNVNPDVDHPRWSQSRERRLGDDGFFAPRRKTLMFNGYADQVAAMYRGMDLRKFF